MKICRFNINQLGLVEGRNVQDVSSVVQLLSSATWPQQPGDMLITNLDMILQEAHKIRRDSATLSVRDLHLNSPVANPTKIIGTPINYPAHREEMNSDPELGTAHSGEIESVETYGLFLKSPIPVGPGDGVRLRFENRRTDHEVELAIVIGKVCQNVAEEEALDFVAGYTIGLDMTVRGTEDRSLRKSIDTHSVLGPWLVTANEIENPDSLDISLSINGKTKQSSNTCEMIYSTRKLIAYASSFYTLFPGDVIMSGTPEGVGPICVGDMLECTIEKIGTMQVPIIKYE